MRHASAPGVIACFGVVVAARLCVRLLGFRRTGRVARWLTRRPPASPTAPPLALARRVALAAAFFPGRARCLEQAVALFVVLRRAGHAASLRIGVQPLPFQAHAWIELDGVPLFEPEATATRLLSFPGTVA